MISGSLHRTFISKEVKERLEQAFQFLKETDFELLEDGTYPICGNEIYAMVQSFHVKQPIDVEFETHRRYIDVQYTISGKLEIMAAACEKLMPDSPYDPKNDVTFYKRSDCCSRVVLYPGEAAVLFPEDAHRMVCFPQEGQTEYIRKCVIKVLV